MDALTEYVKYVMKRFLVSTWVMIGASSYISYSLDVNVWAFGCLDANSKAMALRFTGQGYLCIPWLLVCQLHAKASVLQRVVCDFQSIRRRACFHRKQSISQTQSRPSDHSGNQPAAKEQKTIRAARHRTQRSIA